MQTDTSNEQKELILSLNLEEHSVREVGRLAEKSERVISKFLKKFCETGCEEC